MYCLPLARVKEDVVPSERSSPFVLGLDLGVSSLGWALLDPRNQSFAAAGVRIFNSGMDENKFERGEQGASNNVERRKARLHRRQLRRRAARQRDLFLHCKKPASCQPNHAATPRRTDTACWRILIVA